MNIHRSTHRAALYRRRGFTLVELMLALLISTIIMGTGAAIFSTTVRSWQQGGRNARLRQVAESTADLLEHYLRAALPNDGGANSFSGIDLTEGDEAGHELDFYSGAGGQLPRSQPGADRQHVKITFDPFEADGLIFQIDTFPDEVRPATEDPNDWGYETELAENTTGFKVLYFDGVDWAEEWTESKLPQAIEFHLTLTADSSNPDHPDVITVSRMFTLPMESGEAAAEAVAHPTGVNTNGSSNGGSSNGNSQSTTRSSM